MKALAPAWRVLLLALALCVSIPVAAQAIDPLPFKDHAQELRFQKLAGQLRCLVCQDESLIASNADLARDMRHQMFKLMQAGESDAQIKQYFVDRYSDYVLYDPPVRPRTWLLWFGPGLLLVLGAIGVIVYVRGRARHAPASAPSDAEDW